MGMRFSLGDSQNRFDKLATSANKAETVGFFVSKCVSVLGLQRFVLRKAIYAFLWKAESLAAKH